MERHGYRAHHPALCGLFSLSCLFALALYPDGNLVMQQTAWYHQTQASFSEVLAVVRRALWGNFSFKPSVETVELCLVARAELERLIYAACYGRVQVQMSKVELGAEFPVACGVNSSENPVACGGEL